MFARHRKFGQLFWKRRFDESRLQCRLASGPIPNLFGVVRVATVKNRDITLADYKANAWYGVVDEDCSNGKIPYFNRPTRVKVLRRENRMVRTRQLEKVGENNAIENMVSKSFDNLWNTYDLYVRRF